MPGLLRSASWPSPPGATTITKAIGQINELAHAHGPTAVNQSVRWINTKEEHASHIIKVVSEYFLTQKVKSVAPGADGHEAYLKKLADHHAVMVTAMKTKQSPTPDTAAALDLLCQEIRRRPRPHRSAEGGRLDYHQGHRSDQ